MKKIAAIAIAMITITGCRGVQLPTVLDIVADGVVFTKTQYEKFCKEHPLHKACRGDTKKAIEVELNVKGEIEYRAIIEE